MPLVIASYNAGSAAVVRWAEVRASLDTDLFLEHVPYIETRTYTLRVLSNVAHYAVSLGDEPLTLPDRVGPAPQRAPAVTP